MTEFEQMFIETTNFLDEIGMDYFLHGSTLLNIARRGTVEPRDNHQFDKELNFGVLAENFTDEMYKKMADKFPYFNPQNEKFPNFLIFFGTVAKPPQDTDHWRLLPGFSLLARYWDYGDYRVEYMGSNHCLVFPKKLFTFENVKVLGKTFKTFKLPDYFDYYFGEWKTEDRSWHWTRANCCMLFTDFIKKHKRKEVII